MNTLSVHCPFRRFSLRGLNKVQGEWDLVCLALNVKRMQGLQAA